MELELQIRGQVTFNATSAIYHLGYDVVDLGEQAVIATGKISRPMAGEGTADRLAARQWCLRRARRIMRRLLERNRARAALAGRSLTEVSGWLDNWGILGLNQETRRFRLQHPLEGDQAFVVFFDEDALLDGWPVETGLLEKLLAKCLPGPTGLEATVAGADHVLSCQEVAGAEGYRWYVDGEMVAETAGATCTQALAAGTRSIQVAAVANDGTAGLVTTTQVTVEEPAA